MNSLLNETSGLTVLTRRRVLALAGAAGLGSLFARAACAAMPAAPSWGSVGQGDPVDLPVVEFGTYPQTAAEDPLPIEWYVLAEEDGRRLLFAKQVLDCAAYNVAFTGVTWETCDLRFWLNGAFARAAFTEGERARIECAELVNGDNAAYGICGGNPTRDHLFCLSLDEVDRYLGAGHPALVGEATEYAYKCGIKRSGPGGSIWWLRSPGDDASEAAYVFLDGTVDVFGDGVDYPYYGVRPALWLADQPVAADSSAREGAEAFGSALTCEDGGVVLNMQVDGLGTAFLELAYTVRATYRGALVSGASAKLWTKDALGYYLDEQVVAIDAWDGLEYGLEQRGTVALELAQPACALACQRIECAFEPGLAALPLVEFGSYPQTEAGDVLPIAWRVLAQKDGAQLLLADCALDCVPYHLERANVTWEDCDLRAWLNGAFADAAFTGDERAQVAAVELANAPNPDLATPGGNPTLDEVFCLGFDELAEYLSAGTSKACGVTYPHLSAAATPYAASRGASANADTGAAPWWLRSPGDRASFAACVSAQGLVRSEGYNVEYPTNAVRPALWRTVD